MKNLEQVVWATLVATALGLAVGCGSVDRRGGRADAAGGADASGGPDAMQVDACPGQTVRHVLNIGGLDREFIVYVPCGALDPAPVVFMLHGTSGDGQRFYNISRWREKADAVGIIAVFPSALTHCFFEDDNHDGDFTDPGEQKVTTKWAAGKLGDPSALPLCTPAQVAALPPVQRQLAGHPLADDMAFFRTMLDFIEANYSVDTRRIYASGFSNGGGMTSRLALELSDRFAAIAAAAGTLNLPPVAARPMSFVFSVGNLDPGFTSYLGVPSIPMVPTLLDDLPLFASHIVDPMLTTLELTGDPVYHDENVQGAAVSRFTWSTSLVGASNTFTVLVIEGLEHQYPNGSNHPITMADGLWQFFQGQELP